MLTIRAAQLFDDERFWPGQATVLTIRPAVLGSSRDSPGSRLTSCC